MATNHDTLSLLIHLCSDGVSTFDGKGKNNKINNVKKTIHIYYNKTHTHTHTHVTFLRYRQNTSSIYLTCYRDITHIYLIFFFWQDFCV